HPLICHLVDVGAVARRLWDDVLRPPVKDRFAASLGLAPDACGAWVAFWSGAHDIGKASPAFQAKDRSGAAKASLKIRGFDFDHQGDTPHATVSTRVLREWLAARGVPPAVARRVAVAVGGHHGVFPSAGQWGGLDPATLG